MLIGEAPGEFEDTLGVPFVGRAGAVLDWIINDVPHQFSYLITNRVCCRPQTVVFLDQDLEKDDYTHNSNFSLDQYVLNVDYEIQDKNRDPEPSEMKLCQSHIDELFHDFQPHGVVLLGKIAATYSTPKKVPRLELKHPAYIARLECKLQTMRKESQSLERFVEQIADSIREI